MEVLAGWRKQDILRWTGGRVHTAVKKSTNDHKPREVTYGERSCRLMGPEWSCVFRTHSENWRGLREASGAGYHYHI